MNILITIPISLVMLWVAWKCWQSTLPQPQRMVHQPHQTLSYTPAQPSIRPPVVVTQPAISDDDLGDIPQATLQQWAADDDEPAEISRPAVMRPSWGKTLYEALGVSETASADEIRTAYREQCRIWHPDHNGDPDAGDQFACIGNAYKILTTQRAQYDAGLQIEATTL